MGYKRDGKKYLQDAAVWTKWRKEYADLIAASGVPEIVVSDADHWYDFLDHGYLDHHEDPLHFDIDHLTVRQKAFLLQIVGTDVSAFGSIAGLGLIADLIFAVKERYWE